ncbi:adenylate/guanylate cyclase domain-containing protein [Arenibaculum sp.]|jgi:class 3 adenylate cyclase|uniref:adenylate/guanylate cyclase domain-containing protein n=1 Tax=Arenibaculum sp. TaxID=2865862 RepID=UPI002E0D1D4B|nr:adenylate/guanylate cyclase domain-containing protein [Arenibaculum sp.]
MSDAPSPGPPLPGAPLPSQTPARRRRPLRLPISAVLMAGFGGLMLAAVAAVLALGLLSAGRNTFTLLNDKADLALKSVVVRVRHQLEPARDQSTFLARLIETGGLDVGDPVRLADTLRGALAATPHISSIGFIGPTRESLWISRFSGELRTDWVDLGASEEMRMAIEETSRREGPHWAPPVWAAELGTTLLSLRTPVRKDGKFLGMLMATVTVGDLSAFLSELFVDDNLNAFVLYDRDHVLAHQNLRFLDRDLSRQPDGMPLPLIEQVDDPVLASLWRSAQPGSDLKNQTEARIVEVGGDSYVFLLRTIEGFGTQPWIVGINFRSEEVGGEVRRLLITGWSGVGILLLSVGAALLVGRKISRPIARLAGAAASVGALDLRHAPTLPDSRFRELGEAAEAFNRMVAGLRWFETYVPKGLVLRLIRHGAADGIASEERVVTVMFSDIRGFSALAEDLGPAETALLLNRHFTLVSSCIEAEGGTVDKFIGDAVMAFWGAPEEQPDHAARALRAARAIAAVLAGSNAERAAAGEPPVHIRIGLHTGPVVVGNIGSASRINYTIVGDTVNVAQRIEELGSRVRDPGEATILVSAATVEAAGQGPDLDGIGPHGLRGRSGPVDIFRLRP